MRNVPLPLDRYFTGMSTRESLQEKAVVSRGQAFAVSKPQ